MNFNHARQLLTAAAAQSGPSQKMTARSDCEQRQEMATAGLIEISIEGSEDQPEAVSIVRLTALGSTFLYCFIPSGQSRSPLPVAAAQSAPPRSDAPAVAKWRDKFAEMRMREVR